MISMMRVMRRTSLEKGPDQNDHGHTNHDPSHDGVTTEPKHRRKRYTHHCQESCPSLSSMITRNLCISDAILTVRHLNGL